MTAHHVDPESDDTAYATRVSLATLAANLEQFYAKARTFTPKDAAAWLISTAMVKAVPSDGSARVNLVREPSPFRATVVSDWFYSVEDPRTLLLDEEIIEVRRLPKIVRWTTRPIEVPGGRDVET